MSTAQSSSVPVTTATRNRSMDQQYPRPFFGHLMSIENLRPLTRRCDSSSLTHHATVKNSISNPNPTKPIYIPHCHQCAQRPVICNYCQVPINKMKSNPNNNHNSSNCPTPTVVTNGISRTNIFNNMAMGNNSQSQTIRNNCTSDSDNIIGIGNSTIRSATQSNSSQSIRKQPSNHNQNQNQHQVVQNTQLNQGQNQHGADNSQLASNMQNTIVYNNPSGECSCQPPLIFPSFRPIISNNPRCGWPMKPYNLGAYPRLPGQSPEDPPCFSQTIAHRPSPIVVPDHYTTDQIRSDTRPVQLNYNTRAQSQSSFGALGDCCTTRRSSNTQFNQFKSQNINPIGPSNPSCCGDDDSYR